MSFPDGYVPLVQKGQTKDEFVKEELSKHDLTFEDLVNNKEVYAIVSETENFKEMMAKENAPDEDAKDDKPKAQPEEPKKEEPKKESSMPAAEGGTPENDDLKIEVPEFPVDEDPEIEVEKKAPATSVKKASTMTLRKREYPLLSKIGIDHSTGLFKVTDFGNDDLIESSPFRSKRGTSKRYLELDMMTLDFITPGSTTAPTSDDQGYVTGHAMDVNQFPALRMDMGMIQVQPSAAVGAPDALGVMPTSVSITPQVMGNVHNVLLPKGRLAYIYRALRGMDFMYVGLARGGAVRGAAAHARFINMYMNAAWRNSLRFKLPKVAITMYDKVSEVRYPKLTFGPNANAFDAMNVLSAHPIFGEEIRERSLSAAMGIFADVGDSARVIPTTYKGTTPSFTVAVSQLTPSAGREFITKLGAWGLGGVLRDIDVEFESGMAIDPLNELRGIAAAATLLMLPYHQLTDATKRTLVYHVLQDFYHGDAQAIVLNPLEYNPTPAPGVLPTIVLPVNARLPNPVRIGLQAWLRNAFRTNMTLPRLGGNSRIWDMQPVNAPTLITAVAGGAGPLDMHTGLTRVEDGVYGPYSRALQAQMQAFVAMLARIKMFPKPMQAHFSSAMMTSDYLSSSVSTIMSRALRGWENLDLLPPRPGRPMMVLPTGENVVLPYEGALSFIMFGVSHDTTPVVPWFERKEVPMPSSFPFLLEMEARVTYEVHDMISVAPAGSKITLASMKLYREDVLDLAEFLLKKYIVSTTAETRKRLEYHLFESPFAPAPSPALNVGIPGAFKKDQTYDIDDVYYNHNEETCLYIKLDGVLGTVPVRNPDREHRFYNVFHEVPDENEVVDLRNVLDEKFGNRPLNFAGPVDQYGRVSSNRKMTIDFIKRVAMGLRGRDPRVPANVNYVKVECRTHVKLHELTDEVDAIVNTPTVELLYENGTSNIKFDVSEIPQYYRWDKRPGYDLVTLSVDYFPKTMHLTKYLLDQNPQLGYTVPRLIAGDAGRTQVKDITELVSVMRRSEETIDDGLELIVDTL